MSTHHLKTDTGSFADIVAGRRTLELRLNDRDFQVGDWLVLQEWTFSGRYTGAWVHAQITHVLAGPLGERYGLRPNYAALSLRVTERTAVASTTGGAA